VSLRKCLRVNSLVLEIGLVLLVWFLVVQPLIINRQWVAGFDLLAYSAPAMNQVFESWSDLEIPLWNPTIFGGVPFLGRLGTGSLYLIHFPLIFVDIHLAIQISLALHLLLAAMGFLCFIRFGLRLSAPSGSIAAIVLLASAHIGVNYLSLDRIIAIAWLPWILLCVEKLWKSPNPQMFVVPLSFSCVFLVLGGHPQFIYLNVLFVCGLILVRLFESWDWRRVGYFVLSITMSCGILALPLIATYFLTRDSPTSGPKDISALQNPSFVLAPKNIWLGVIGDPFSPNPLAVTGAGEAIAGCGVLAVLLAGIAVFARKSKDLRNLSIFLVVIGLITLLMSVGPRWFPFRLAYEYLPGFSSARVPGRLLYVTLLSVVMLAAIGAHSFVNSKVDRRRIALFAVAAVLALLTIQQTSITDMSRSLFSWTFLVLGILSVACLVKNIPKPIAILIPLLLLLIEVGSSLPRAQDQFTRLDKSITEYSNEINKFLGGQLGLTIALTQDKLSDLPYLSQSLRPNTNSIHAIRSIDGYDGGPLIQNRWVESMSDFINSEFNLDLTLRSQIDRPLHANLAAQYGLRWAVIDTEIGSPDNQLSGWRGPLMVSESLELWENPFVTGNAQIYFQNSRSLRPPSPSHVYVDEQHAIGSCLNDCQGNVQIIDYSNKKMSAKVESGSKAIVAFPQAWHKDWKSRINSQDIKAFPINEFLIGVAVEPGLSSVELEFKPTWVMPLTLLSLTFLLLSLIYELYVTIVWRQREDSAQSRT